MGSSASQQKRPEIQKMNLAQAIIKGIEVVEEGHTNNITERPTATEEYELRPRPSFQSNDSRQVWHRSPKKKSWFYYEEQIKQEEQRREFQNKFTVNLLDVCKVSPRKQRVTNLANKLSTLATKSDHPSRADVGELSHIPRQQQLLRLPTETPKAGMERRKRVTRNFRTNLLEIVRVPKSKLGRSSSEESNKNDIPSFQKSYQDILQIMDSPPTKAALKRTESQHLVYQRKVQRDLIPLLSARSPITVPDKTRRTEGDELRIPYRMNFPETSILTMQELPLTPISGSFAKQFLNFDMIDHIPEDSVHHGEGTVKNLTNQIHERQRQVPPLQLPMANNVTHFTLNGSPARSATSRHRHHPSMTNPTALFPQSCNGSFHSEQSSQMHALHRYEIIGHLGAGSFGKVKLARYYNQEVVVRIVKGNRIKPKLLTTMVGQHTLFEMQVALLKHMDHPNLCRVIDAIHNPDTNRFYFISEFAEFGSLPFGISEEQALHYFRDLLCGLDYSTKQFLQQLVHNTIDITHRNIKPSNVLIDSSNTLRIVDAGLWHLMEPLDDQTFTLDYFNLAPEIQNMDTPQQRSPTHNQSHQGRLVDVWAAGILLYQMTVGEVQPDYQNGVVQSPRYLSDALRNLLRLMLHVDPQKRISVRDMMEHPWVTRVGCLVNVFPWSDFDEDEIEHALTLIKC